MDSFPSPTPDAHAATLPIFHIVDMDDWMLIFRDGELIYNTHPRGDMASTLTLSGCPVHVFGACSLDVADEVTWNIASPPTGETREAFELRCRSYGVDVVWHPRRPLV